MTDVYGQPYLKTIPGVSKCKRPKFVTNGRHVWSGCPIVDHDGTTISGWYETMYGAFVYFVRVDQAKSTELSSGIERVSITSQILIVMPAPSPPTCETISLTLSLERIVP